MIIKILLVIFLTLSSSCALLSTNSDFSDNDPIAQAALYGRRKLYREENSAPRKYRIAKEDEIKRALEAGQLTLGMKMNDVLSIWGQPAEIETAGDPLLGNQKWIYGDSLLQEWKSRSSRSVYFEEGQVAGWENHP